MSRTKSIALGGILSGFTILFQIIPVLFTEALAPLTMLSALPVYLITRIHPRMGVVSFTAAAVIIFAVSPHEGLLFLGTNGIVGLSLGICGHFDTSKLRTVAVTGILLSLCLISINFVVGIPVLGFPLGDTVWIAAVIIILFSFTYSGIYFYFARLVFRAFRRFIPKTDSQRNIEANKKT